MAASLLKAIIAVLLLVSFSQSALAGGSSYSFVQAWGENGASPGQFTNPIGIAIAGQQVFVSDTGNSRIQVFGRHGNFLRMFGLGGPGKLERPMHMDVKGGKLYVADFDDRIHVFSLAGEFLQLIGSSGSDPGQFDAPAGVTADSKGHLYVADFYNQRVQVLSESGIFIRQYGVTGELGVRAGRFNYPTDVAMLPDNSLVVADAYNDRIQVFGADGAFVRKWGGFLAINISGSRPGWFKTATGVAVGPGDHIFVADFYNNRVQEFTREGRFVSLVGSKSSGPGQLKLPTDTAFDDEGRLYVVDFGNNRIVKFSPMITK